ncbi:MAG: hypothetical protein JF606_04995 [Burkholderiales bacterium]|jgi:hypothetical protein|nr:hypothetical protein [Burkholderiales bacterium]
MSDPSIRWTTLSIRIEIPNESKHESRHHHHHHQGPRGNLMDRLQEIFSMLMPVLRDMQTKLLPGIQNLFDQPPKQCEDPHHPDEPDSTAPSTSASGFSGSPAHSVGEAADRAHPTFRPVLRGDEKEKDAKIKSQADFGRAADEVAREYGLDPNAFRAQLQVESSAFTNGYQQAMKHEGDLDRAGENNTSIGLGQISRKFLDGREWSDDGPGDRRVGSQVVTTDQYMNSPTIQLRMAASNLAQRIADHGGLNQGLAYYVSGSSDPSSGWAAKYIENINKFMNDSAVTDVGR